VKRVTCMVLSLIVFMASWPLVTHAQEDTNWALTEYGGTWRATLTYSHGERAEFAFDGDPNTFWSSGTFKAATLYRTLPTAKRITKIVVRWHPESKTQQRTWTLSYKRPGQSDWVVLDTGSRAAWPREEPYEYYCDVTAAEWSFTLRQSKDTTNLAEFELWGYEYEITATPSADGVLITTKDMLPPLTVCRSELQIGTSDTASYTDTDYPPGETVTYTVTDATGKSSSATVLTCPAPPVLAATPDVDRVQLSWPAVSTATNYIIYRGGAQIGETQELTYTDRNLAPNTTLVYRAAAVNLSGPGRVSGPVQVITLEQPPPPDAPTLIVTGRTTSSLSVVWDSIPGVSGYKVYIDGALAGQTAGTVWTFAGLVPATEYRLSVQAYSGEYDGAVSSPVYASTIGPPGPVSNLIATAGATEASLTWMPPAAGDLATGYRIYRAGTLIADTGDTYYIDQGLIIGTSYTYEVRAYNDAGEGPGVSATIITDDLPVPTMPAGLEAQATQRTITTQWQPAEWAIKYRIYIDGALVSETSLAQYKAVGLVPATRYTIEVRACNEAGESLPASLSVTTLDGTPALTVSPYGSGFIARWAAPGQALEDMPDSYDLRLDNELVAGGLQQSYYGQDKLAWTPGSIHTVTIDAVYGSKIFSTSAEVTALLSSDPVDSDDVQAGVSFSIRSMWPILAVVTAFSMAFLAWDGLWRLIRGW